MKRLTGRLKLCFLTENGRFHWNQGKKKSPTSPGFGEPWFMSMVEEALVHIYPLLNEFMIMVIRWAMQALVSLWLFINFSVLFNKFCNLREFTFHFTFQKESTSTKLYMYVLSRAKIYSIGKLFEQKNTLLSKHFQIQS